MTKVKEDIINRLEEAIEWHLSEDALWTEAAHVLRAARDEIEELRKDAYRYRFIRDTPWCDPLARVIAQHRNTLWDQVIDEWMNKK